MDESAMDNGTNQQKRISGGKMRFDLWQLRDVTMTKSSVLVCAVDINPPSIRRKIKASKWIDASRQICIATDLRRNGLGPMLMKHRSKNSTMNEIRRCSADGS